MAENKTWNGGGEKHVKKRRRAEDVRQTIKILESEKYFYSKKILGRGTYGDVFMMYDTARNSNVAVKIITSENIAEIELDMWPKLRHPNIVPVLEAMTIRSLKVAVFVMPVQRKSLHDLLYDTRFLCRSDSLDYLKIWLSQTLYALDYLESRDLCHLDIKVDNVLISNEYRAMLCDFSFLNYGSKCLERYDLGLPYIYRPPEACHTLGSDISIDGRAYDMWGFGVMTLEIFTHFVLATNITDCQNWIKEVYPTLFTILQEKEFCNLMIQTFPGSNMSQYEAKLALDFIHSFLMLKPLERSLTTEALDHQFLSSGMYLASCMDSIWTDEVYSKSISLPSVKSWIKKSPHFDEEQIGEVEGYNESDVSDPSTDDEYLTMSDSDDDTKDSNSSEEYMNISEEKDDSNTGNTEIEQVNKNQSLIEQKFFNKKSDSSSEFDFSQMGDVFAIKKGEGNLNLWNSEHSLTIHSNDVKHNNNKETNVGHSFSQRESKILQKRMKKKFMLSKKSRLHRYPMKSKIFKTKSEIYMIPYRYMHLSNAPNSEKLLKKLHYKKTKKVISNRRYTFYRIHKKNCTFSNIEIYTKSDISSVSLTSAGNCLKSDSYETCEESEDSKPNECLKTFLTDMSKEEHPPCKNKNLEQEHFENNSKWATGDNVSPEFRNLIDLTSINFPSNSCNVVTPSLKADSSISLDDELLKNVDVNEASNFIESVSKTLGKLNEINSILHKVLICERCDSKRKTIEQAHLENRTLLDDRSGFVFLDKQERREIKENHGDDETHMRANLNVCSHEINCNHSYFPLEIGSSQNVNLIINSPALQQKILKHEISKELKFEESSESGCACLYKMRREKFYEEEFQYILVAISRFQEYQS